MTKLKEYATLVAQIRVLEEQAEAIKEMALLDLRAATGDNVEQPVEVEGVGIVRLGVYGKWVFGDRIVQMQSAVKEAESMAKANGEARKEEKFIIKFFKV